MAFRRTGVETGAVAVAAAVPVPAGRAAGALGAVVTDEDIVRVREQRRGQMKLAGKAGILTTILCKNLRNR
jgi:hypothetical protein